MSAVMLAYSYRGFLQYSPGYFKAFTERWAIAREWNSLVWHGQADKLERSWHPDF